LVQAIEKLRQEDDRFRRITPEVHHGIVRLRGSPSPAGWRDLFELARAVARLPGVKRVILEDERTAANRR
jgi:hypothetical protein